MNKNQVCIGDFCMTANSTIAPDGGVMISVPDLLFPFQLSAAEAKAAAAVLIRLANVAGELRRESTCVLCVDVCENCEKGNNNVDPSEPVRWGDWRIKNE